MIFIKIKLIEIVAFQYAPLQNVLRGTCTFTTKACACKGHVCPVSTSCFLYMMKCKVRFKELQFNFLHFNRVHLDWAHFKMFNTVDFHLESSTFLIARQLYNVCGPFMVIVLCFVLLLLLLMTSQLYLSGMQYEGLDLRPDTRKICVRNILNYMLESIDHSRFNSQHKWRGRELYEFQKSTL